MKLRAVALAILLAGCASAGEAAKPSSTGGAPSIAVGEPNPSAPGGLKLPGDPVGAPNAPSGVSKADKKIDLGDWHGAQSPDALSDAFAAQIDARYGPEPGLQAVKSDLEANGFSCRDAAPVEARTDYLMTTCEKQEMHQSCGNIWSVAVRFEHESRSLDSTRVTPRGGFERLCLGANSPKTSAK